MLGAICHCFGNGYYDCQIPDCSYKKECRAMMFRNLELELEMEKEWNKNKEMK